MTTTNDSLIAEGAGDGVPFLVDFFDGADRLLGKVEPIGGVAGVSFDQVKQGVDP